MEALQITQNIKTYSLSFDEPHMSFTRNDREIVFKEGDQILVDDSSDVKPGLILVSTSLGIRLCRYEFNNGVGALFPPLDVLNQSCLILGQVIDG